MLDDPIVVMLPFPVPIKEMPPSSEIVVAARGSMFSPFISLLSQINKTNDS